MCMYIPVHTVHTVDLVMESSVLYRLSARRNLLQSYRATDRPCLQLVVTTEDHAFVYTDKQLALQCQLLRRHASAPVPVQVRVEYSGSGVYAIALSAGGQGLEEGEYQLQVRTDETDEPAVQVQVLAFTSDVFAILRDPASANSTSLLSSFREFRVHKQRRVSPSSSNTHVSVRIKETYGKTLGSHMWDASYVLAMYLCEHVDLCGSILELGCGCGAAGIACAASNDLARVMLTDLAQLQTAAQTNIGINGLANCSVEVLDWCDASHIERVHTQMHAVDVIIAADVTYCKSATLQLLSLIQQIGCANSAQVFIAQKMRVDSVANPTELCAGLEWEKVAEQWGVIVWKLQLTPRH